ncbi:hypothetical protein RC1_3546 [Rhodospirillum centenum SW]|uniref:Uncharacterized protein n=1 Tax=Rhodospirillum centenum (strain ATCC 51521 / SW) TaxID=414684 RepID=B6IX75_RHOCS|nr:hypothetical protein RC1_3546 [Rhodospirillum centenum SW]
MPGFGGGGVGAEIGHGPDSIRGPFRDWAFPRKSKSIHRSGPPRRSQQGPAVTLHPHQQGRRGIAMNEKALAGDLESDPGGLQSVDQLADLLAR